MVSPLLRACCGSSGIAALTSADGSLRRTLLAAAAPPGTHPASTASAATPAAAASSRLTPDQSRRSVCQPAMCCPSVYAACTARPGAARSVTAAEVEQVIPAGVCSRAAGLRAPAPGCGRPWVAHDRGGGPPGGPRAAHSALPPCTGPNLPSAPRPQVHCALERCIQRGMSKLEAVQLLARLGVEPKFSTLGAWPPPAPLTVKTAALSTAAPRPCPPPMPRPLGAAPSCAGRAWAPAPPAPAAA